MANILQSAKQGWENLKAWGKVATDKPTRDRAFREWIQPEIQKTVRTVKPQIQEAFWTPAARLQKWLQQAEYTPRTEIKAWQPKGLPGQLAKGVTESYLNIPRNILVGSTRLGGLTGDVIRGEQKGKGEETFTRLLSGAAPLTESLLDVYTPGAAKGLFKASGKALIKQGIKVGALQGLGEGGIGGIAYEAGKEPRTIDWNQATQSGIAGAVFGTVLGGVIGGGGAALGQLRRKVSSAIQKVKPDIPASKIQKQTDDFIRDELGRFAGRKKKDPVFYGDLRESLGLPRDGDYRSGKIDFGAKVSQISGPQVKKKPQVQPSTRVSAEGVESVATISKLEQKRSRSLLRTKAGRTEQPRYKVSKKSQDIIQQAHKQIGNLGSTNKKNLGQTFDEFYTNWVNRFHPVEKVVGAIEKKLKVRIRPEFDPRIQLKRLMGAGGVAELRHKGTLNPIMDQLKDIDHRDFDIYMKARRDLTLADRGIKGSNKTRAQNVINSVIEKYGGEGTLDKVAQQLYDYQKNGLEMLRDAGLISKEVFERIEEVSKDYVPFKRIMDQLDEYLGLPTTKLQVGTAQIKKIKGSDRQILSPMESIIADTYRIEAAVAKNRVAQSIARLSKIDPELSKVFVRAKKSSASTISVWEKGEKNYYDIGRELANVVKGLNEENMGTLLKLISAPAAVLRQGATGRNIDFIIPNIVKDQFDAAINSQYGYKPFIGYIQGLGHLLKAKFGGGDELVENWINSGGKIFFERLSGQKAVGEQIATATRKRNLLKQIGEWAIGGMETIGEFSESPTRIGLFKNALEKTGNPLLAALEAREGTLDFARMGAKMKVANSIIPFLNVGVQGFDRLIRSVKADPKKVAINVAAYGLLPQTMVSLYNNLFHPNEISQVPQWEKDSNFVLVTGVSKDGKPEYVKVPKGNVLPIVANPIDDFISHVAETDNKTFSQSVLSLLSGALPIVGEGNSLKEIITRTIGQNLPQVVKPIAESITNKSFFFTDEKGEPREIVPYYLEKKPEYQQFNKSTPEAYKVAGKILSVSPLKIKHLMEGYLAGYIKVPVNMVETIDSASRGEPVDPNRIPVLRRFFGTYGDFTTTTTTKEDSSKFAVEAADMVLPTSGIALKTIYGDAKSDLNNYEKRKARIEFGDYEEWEKTYKLEELNKKKLYAERLVYRVEQEKSDELFSINLRVYGKDHASGILVEDRARWVYEELSEAKNEEELDMLLEQMWDNGVITTGTRGVAQKILDEYGLNVFQGGKYKKSTGKAGAKVRKPTLTFKKAPTIKKVSIPKSKKIQLKKVSVRKTPISIKRTIPRVRLKTK